MFVGCSFADWFCVTCGLWLYLCLLGLLFGYVFIVVGLLCGVGVNSVASVFLLFGFIAVLCFPVGGGVLCAGCVGCVVIADC